MPKKIESFENFNEGVTMLHKEQVKSITYHISDEIEKLLRPLASPGCADDETGAYRNRVMRILDKAREEIKEVADEIY